MRRPGLPRRAIAALTLALLAMAAGLVAAAIQGALRGASDGWLIRAVTSRGFLISAAITFASAAALLAVCWALWQAGAAGRQRRDGQSGAAVLEFAMALPIALVLVLIMTQSSLLMGGNLCVHYAAYCAARSAIVQIPRDLSPSEPPNVVTEGGSSKRLKIKLAAVWAVMPVSSSSKQLPTGSGSIADDLKSFFDDYDVDPPGWLRSDKLGRMMNYAEEHTQIELMQRVDMGQDEPPEYHTLSYPYIYGEHEEVRVVVRHKFYLAVPYADWLFHQMGKANGVDLGDGYFGLMIDAATSLTNEGTQDYIEIEKFY